MVHAKTFARFPVFIETADYIHFIIFFHWKCTNCSSSPYCVSVCFFFVLFFLHKWSIICSRALRDSISHFRYPLCYHVRDFVSFRLLNLPHPRSFLVFLSLLFHTLFPRLLSPYSLVLLLRAGFFLFLSLLCAYFKIISPPSNVIKVTKMQGVTKSERNKGTGFNLAVDAD